MFVINLLIVRLSRGQLVVVCQMVKSAVTGEHFISLLDIIRE